jgi:type VI secretion system Hcp family effector
MLAGAAVAAGFFWLAGSAAQASITMSCSTAGIKDIPLLSVSGTNLKQDAVEDKTGARKTDPDVKDITIMREVDKATPKLDSFKNGSGLGVCTIHWDKAEGGRPTEYLTITLTDAMVSSYSFAENNGGGKRGRLETIKLTFRKIEVSDRVKGPSDSSTFTKPSPKST